MVGGKGLLNETGERMTPDGRAVSITDHGRTIAELFG